MNFVTLKEKGAPGTAFGICLVIWLLGVTTPFTFGGAVHLFLGLAVVLFVLEIRRRRQIDSGVAASDGEIVGAEDLVHFGLTEDPRYATSRAPRLNRLRQAA